MKLNYNKAINAGYSDQEIRDYAKKKKVTLIDAPAKEGVGTFLKGIAEGTGVPKSLANIGALGTTIVGAGAMAINKPEVAENLYKKALDLRRYAGTEGSFDQGVGSGMTTLGRGAVESGKTYLTALGLRNPAAAAKMAKVTVVPSAVISKALGGTFSEGAGSAIGSAPANVAVANIIRTALGKTQYVKNIASEKKFVGKIRQTLLPWENVAKTGGAKAEAAARHAADIKMSTVWEKTIDEALASRDPTQLNAVKAFASMGQDAQTKRQIMKASNETLKYWATQTRPSKAIDALFARRSYGKMASWKNFLQNLIDPGEASKSKAAKLMYKNLNLQLQKNTGILKADQLVANAKLVGAIVSPLFASLVGGKGFSLGKSLLKIRD